MLSLMAIGTPARARLSPASTRASVLCASSSACSAVTSRKARTLTSVSSILESASCVTSTAERRRDDTSRAIEMTLPGAALKTDGSGVSRLASSDDPRHRAVPVRKARRILFQRFLSGSGYRSIFTKRRGGEFGRTPRLLPNLLQLIDVRENAGELMRQAGKLFVGHTKPGECRDVAHDPRADGGRLGGHTDNCKAF